MIALGDRFWSKVDKSGECWVWTAAHQNSGHGVFRVAGRNFLAHRLSWAEHAKREPEDCVLHLCDNPPCVRPDHLFEGTQADNMRDMTAKGRHGMSAKTHCPSGHPYDAENTKWYDGRRYCRACNVAACRKRDEKRRIERRAAA